MMPFALLIAFALTLVPGSSVAPSAHVHARGAKSIRIGKGALNSTHAPQQHHRRVRHK